MTLYPCPICRQEPEIGPCYAGYFASCWCKTMYAETKKGLLHQWNDLYCANDPADGRDCE